MKIQISNITRKIIAYVTVLRPGSDQGACNGLKHKLPPPVRFKFRFFIQPLQLEVNKRIHIKNSKRNLPLAPNRLTRL